MAKIEERKGLFSVTAGTAGQWAQQNPVLPLGVLGYESDTNILRSGDGKSRFVDLPAIGVTLPDGTENGQALVFAQDGESGEWVARNLTASDVGAVKLADDGFADAVQISGGLNVVTTANLDRVLTEADLGRWISVNSSTDAIYHIPAHADWNAPVGSFVYIMRLGTGNVTIASDGPPLTSPNGQYTINNRYGFVLLKRLGNSWDVIPQDVPYRGASLVDTNRTMLASGANMDELPPGAYTANTAIAGTLINKPPAMNTAGNIDVISVANSTGTVRQTYTPYYGQPWYRHKYNNGAYQPWTRDPVAGTFTVSVPANSYVDQAVTYPSTLGTGTPAILKPSTMSAAGVRSDAITLTQTATGGTIRVFNDSGATASITCNWTATRAASV